MDNSKFTVSSTPHIRSNDSTSTIMRDVIIALTPAALMGIWAFGFKALLIIAVSIASCVCFEALFQKITKQKITVYDLSAIVTGLLLAMNLPSSAPVWLPIVGGFFAIVIAKQLFGGIGQNFINPALAARAFLVASYPTSTTGNAFTQPTGLNSLMESLGIGTSSFAGALKEAVADNVNNITETFKNIDIDAISSATPLEFLKNDVVKEISFTPQKSDILNAIFGNIGGCIGETCAIALILGGLYLLFRKVISWRIPVTYIATVFILTWAFGRVPYYEIFIGGLMLGAFFMATDYSSSPVTPVGQIIMGVGCGILTSLIRVYGGYPEGVSYSILLMNLAVPLIDRYTKPRIFGGGKAK